MCWKGVARAIGGVFVKAIALLFLIWLLGAVAIVALFIAVFWEVPKLIWECGKSAWFEWFEA